MLKSCANGSNIVALRFGDHGTKEMLGVVSWKVWLVSNFAQQHATTSNNMQQGVQMDATCNIQQCWELLANNVASICMGPNPFMPCPDLQYTEQPCLLAKFAHTVENQTWKNYSPLQKQEGNWSQNAYCNYFWDHYWVRHQVSQSSHLLAIFSLFLVMVPEIFVLTDSVQFPFFGF